MVTDPTSDLAQHLVVEMAKSSPSLFVYLVAQGRDLPDSPAAASRVVRERWPALTEEERRIAFASARNVLMAVSNECVESVARLDLLSGETGRG